MTLVSGLVNEKGNVITETLVGNMLRALHELDRNGPASTLYRKNGINFIDIYNFVCVFCSIRLT